MDEEVELEPGEVIEQRSLQDPCTAASNGDMISVLEWLKTYPDTNIDEMDNVNRHLLSEACFGGNRELVTHLLSLGANPNVDCRESNYNTPLSVAVVMNDPVIVSLLLNHGANPGIPNFRGDTAYHHAVLIPDSLEMLLLRRPPAHSVNIGNSVNETPLEVARELGIERSYNILQWYLDHA